MHDLLHDSEEEETPAESSQDTLVQESQESLATLPSSQAKEIIQHESMSHDDYINSLRLDKRTDRVQVLPKTRRPRLYQHGPTTYPALLHVSGVDDGRRIAATGIVWELFGISYEVVLCASLGWSTSKGNYLSHKVVPTGSVYVFLREVQYADSPIVFGVLNKINCHGFFRLAEPACDVLVDQIKKTSDFLKDFLRHNTDDVKLWTSVTTIKTATTRRVLRPKKAISAKVVHTDTPRPRSNKRTSLRIRRLLTKADEVRKSQEDDEEYSAKIKKMKLESQREIRAIKAQTKETLGIHFQKFQTKVQSKLDIRFEKSQKKFETSNTRFKTSLTKMSTTVKDLSKKLTSVKNEVQRNMKKMSAGFDDIHGRRDAVTGRLLELEDTVQNVQKTLKAENKKLRKLFDNLKKEVTNMTKKVGVTQKKVQDFEKKVNTASKRKRKIKKEKSKRKKEKRTRKAQAVAGPGPTPFVMTMPSQSMPQPSLQPPPPPPMTAMEIQSRRPHYVSPIYSARNYAR